MQVYNDSAENELIENVLLSTENALKALGYLEHSLVKGRFKEGIGSYALMCNTLLVQRAWSLNKSTNEIDENFRKISLTARSIIKILKPYIENLEKLSALFQKDDLGNHEIIQNMDIKDMSHSGDKDQDKLISVLKNQTKKRISYTNLRSLLEWDRKKLDELLKAIENSNIIAINNSGARKMITLKNEIT